MSAALENRREEILPKRCISQVRDLHKQIREDVYAVVGHEGIDVVIYVLPSSLKGKLPKSLSEEVYATIRWIHHRQRWLVLFTGIDRNLWQEELELALDEAFEIVNVHAKKPSPDGWQKQIQNIPCLGAIYPTGDELRLIMANERKQDETIGS